ncbi:MAG: hypothetical protein QXE05_09875, partial [Nitrososphaeria archaeon]
LERCMENKIKEYDFMKGDELYKFDWCSTYRRNLNFRFVNRRLTSKLFKLGIQATKKLKMDKFFGKYLNF